MKKGTPGDTNIPEEEGWQIKIVQLKEEGLYLIQQ